MSEEWLIPELAKDGRTLVECGQLMKGFIAPFQAVIIAENMAGEEGEFFEQMIRRYADRIDRMPKTYEQDGKGEEAVVYLHYFKGGYDWFILEKDSDPDREGQMQAFGYANLGFGAELGYISLQELIKNRVELNLYFEPTKVSELKKNGRIE